MNLCLVQAKRKMLLIMNDNKNERKYRRYNSDIFLVIRKSGKKEIKTDEDFDKNVFSRK